MVDRNRPHPLVTFLFDAFLLVFFGGGLLLFINLFIRFLPEAAFAIFALSVGAMLLILVIVGKCVQVITALRGPSNVRHPVDAVSTDEQSQTAEP